MLALTQTQPAPAPLPRLEGLAVGCARTVSLPLGDVKPRGPEESEESFELRAEYWEMLRRLRITVLHQQRKKTQLASLRLSHLRAQLAGLDMDALFAGDPQEAANQMNRLNDAYRAFLLEEVIDPLTGASHGPLLVKVEGADLRTTEGLLGLETLTGETLVNALDELQVLELVGNAAIRAQEPTRAQGN